MISSVNTVEQGRKSSKKRKKPKSKGNNPWPLETTGQDCCVCLCSCSQHNGFASRASGGLKLSILEVFFF